MRDESLRRAHYPRVGSFRYLVRDDRWEWSDEVARMHGYEPDTVTPTTELVLAHKHPNDRAMVAGLIEQVRRHASPFSSRHRIIDTRGAEHLVVVVGDRCYDDHGAPAGVAGFYVDITEQFDADVQKRLTKEVVTISERRAVINQATGMLMLRYRLTADSAFGLLTQLSQESNTKLRVIAERIVANTADGGALLDNVADPGSLREVSPDVIV